MDNFLRALPVAAGSPTALAAYVAALIVFLFAGWRLVALRSVMAKIDQVPPKDRRQLIREITNSVVPESISPEQWIRAMRLRWTMLLIAGVLLAAMVVAVIALTSKPITNTQLNQAKDKIIESVNDNATTIAKKIDDAALKTLETQFELMARTIVEVDGTIVHLDGSGRQRVVSYDHNLKPMFLRWGDLFHYFVFTEHRGQIRSDASLSLEVRSGQGPPLSLPLDTRLSEGQIRVPGHSPKPMEAYLVYSPQWAGAEVKITIYSADRERARARFREALSAADLDDAARRRYQQVVRDDTPLQAQPNPKAPQLRFLEQGTYAVIEDTSHEGWARIRIPEGREGWVRSDAVSMIRAPRPLTDGTVHLEADDAFRLSPNQEFRCAWHARAGQTSCRLIVNSRDSEISLAGAGESITPSHDWYPTADNPTIFLFSCTDGHTATSNVNVVYAGQPARSALRER